MIIMILLATGLNEDFKKMLKTGVKPIFLGLIVWLTAAIVSLGVQFLGGTVLAHLTSLVN